MLNLQKLITPITPQQTLQLPLQCQRIPSRKKTDMQKQWHWRRKKGQAWTHLSIQIFSQRAVIWSRGSPAFTLCKFDLLQDMTRSRGECLIAECCRKARWASCQPAIPINIFRSHGRTPFVPMQREQKTHKTAWVIASTDYLKSQLHLAFDAPCTSPCGNTCHKHVKSVEIWFAFAGWSWQILQYAVKGTSSEESNDRCQCQKQPWKVSAWEHRAQRSGMIGEQHTDFPFPKFACETRREPLRLYDTEELQGRGGLPIMIVP